MSGERLGFVDAMNSVDNNFSFGGRAGFGGGMGGMGCGGMGGMGGAVENQPGSAPADAVALADSPADKRESRLAEDEAKEFLGRTRGALGQERGLAAKAKRAEFFATLDQTREWAETQYYRVRLQGQTAALIPASPFWREYLEKGRQRTVSSKFARSSNRFRSTKRYVRWLLSIFLLMVHHPKC